MVYKTDNVIQRSIAFAVIITTILSFILSFNSKTIIFALLGLFLCLTALFIIYRFIDSNPAMSSLKFIRYIESYILLYMAIGLDFYSLVVIKAISEGAFVKIYTFLLTLITTIAGYVKYWDSKQLKWAFSLALQKGVYTKGLIPVVENDITTLEIKAKCNKSKSRIAFLGFCNKNDIRKVAGKKRDYLEKIYNPELKDNLQNAPETMLRSNIKRDFDNNCADITTFSIPIANTGVAENLKNWLNPKWAIFVDNYGELWGIVVKIQRKK
ncbi:hypothetical protein [uncultured Lactobacillus sp.]|uniref:hypothetical protein n=1 Tax=uncultured Lactobacillus sp. TaxID=153152 RepID=UPI00259B3CA5|nr:hypothetical protein [uncultured Lactobacillus sp.]